MLTSNQLIEQYHTIWNAFKRTSLNLPLSGTEGSLLDRGFVFQFDENIVRPDILFLGINPSYSNGVQEFTGYTQEQALEYSYFQPFLKIAEELEATYNRKITWTHTDLLVFRETNQAYIKNVLFKSEDGIRFISEQLEVAKQIIEYLNPKAIVVSNTQARQFLGYERYLNKKTNQEVNIWMDFHAKMDHDLGTPILYSAKNADFHPPTFFTSMLSGQRALDIGTRERLIWHLNYVLDKTSH